MSHDLAPIHVFCSYAHEDEEHIQKLKTHLSGLEREGLISVWYDRHIPIGTDWAQAIDTHLETASLILLLVSANFLASDYCYNTELPRAMQRHQAKLARLFPIIVSPCDWDDAPFAHLQSLPRDGKPITTWEDQEQAWHQIADSIRQTARPRVWNLPYPPNPFFTGRDDLLKHLRTQLQTEQIAAISQPQAISGLGGIGKTQLSVEYAYRHARDYQAILWVRADTHEALISGYVALAKILDLPQKDEDNQTIIAQAVKHWLKTHREWLLIFDNADDLSIVSPFLRSPFVGHILLTTRAHAVGPLAQRMEVETMSQEVGALLLLRRAHLIKQDASLETASPADRATACAIAHELGGLPLALDQAGAYLEETGCSLTFYLQIYQQHRMQLLERRGSSYDDYPFSVATTWVLCFEQIKQQSPAAADLLCCCAFLHPDAIPEEFFTDGSRHLGLHLQEVGCSAFAFNEAIRVLLAYSLIHRDSDAATLSIHRLVQAVVLDTMSEEQRSLWRERVVQALNEVFPERGTRCERLLPHVLWQEHELMPIPEAPSLLDKAGAYLLERAQHREAEALLRRALEMRKQQLGAKHPDNVKTLNNLAVLSFDQARYKQVKSLALRALAIICKRSSEVGLPEIAMNLLARGMVHLMQSEQEQGLSLLEQALSTYERCLGPQDPETTKYLSALAAAYGQQGRYEQAESLYEQALSIYEQSLGTLPRRMLHHLTECYYVQGKYEQAEYWLKRMFKVCEETVGMEHLETAACVSGLARVYLAQGKYAEAKLFFDQLIKMDKEHPEASEYSELAYALHGLAKFSQYEEEYERAENYYRRALAILEQPYRISWLNKQEVQRDYATLLRLQGRDEEATMLETSHTEGDH